MGAAGSHIPPLPNLPSKIGKAAITQALSRKLDKRNRLSRTLRRIIHYNSKHLNHDQCKQFRELVSSWTTVELSRFVELYESTITLHQVAAEAASARYLTHNGAADLLTILEKQICTDLIIRYEGCCFPCHRAILISRSSYFEQLLSRQLSDTVDIPSSRCTVDSTVFLHFLNFLYSDSLPNEELISSVDFKVLCQQFGVLGTSSEMLRDLHQTGAFSDFKLVFLRINQSNVLGASEPLRLAEYPCHSFVLASRSELLCNLTRRIHDAINSGNPAEIVLDDSVVSHKYGPLLLNIIYQDELNLSLVSSQANVATSSSLSEAQAIVAGRSNITLLEETMELHHIGNFLELPILIEKCEDYIVRSLSPENLSAILSWSQESSGSKWVYREALQYIQDNFIQISQSPALFSLDEDTLAKVLQSDFVQASELDVLKAIINWSEHQLIQRLGKEPNLVTNRAPSLAKKGFKSKYLDDSQLREIASPLMLHIRQSHLFSFNSEAITSAVKRGLISRCNLAPQRNTASSEPVLDQHIPLRLRDAWLPSQKSNSVRYEIPRGYMPFYEVARSLLEERTKDMSESDVVHLRRPSRPNAGLTTQNRSQVLRHSTIQNMTRFQEELSQLPFGQDEVEKVIRRTQQLLHKGIVVQALQACWDKSAVLKQVCLWAVRELGYADQIIYTINNRTDADTDQYSTDCLSSSLVPDLAPEKLILQHGLSSSFENLTIHSVNSSPDVTLLSVSTYRRDVTTAPDITLHSRSSSENESNSPVIGAAGKSRSKKIRSLQRSRNGSTVLAHRSLPLHKPSRAVITKPDSTQPVPPDIVGGSPPNNDLHITAAAQNPRQHATLDSRHMCSRRNPGISPYYTQQRTSLTQRNRNNDLLYSSLTAGTNHNYIVASTGPPPDVAPQPARRTTGMSLPPDITASPNNTWHAML